jgi:hypothetical protein
VNLVVAVAETVAVPSVLGLRVEQARRVLSDSRLAFGGRQIRGTRVEQPGTVLAQSSEAGTRVTVGTPVVLTIAALPVVAVPPVVGMPHDDAAAAITAAGLEVGTVDLRFSLRAGGTVLAQALAPGAQVQLGTSVAIEEARSRAVWMAPAAAVLFLAGVVGLVKARAGDTKMKPPLHLAIGTNVDDGEAHVQSDEARAIRREVRVQPVADGGSQEVRAEEGDLIRGERRDRADDGSPPEEKS